MRGDRKGEQCCGGKRDTQGRAGSAGMNARRGERGRRSTSDRRPRFRDVWTRGASHHLKPAAPIASLSPTSLSSPRERPPSSYNPSRLKSCAHTPAGWPSPGTAPPGPSRPRRSAHQLLRQQSPQAAAGQPSAARRHCPSLASGSTAYCPGPYARPWCAPPEKPCVRSTS